jgi:hypothetical protein
MIASLSLLHKCVRWYSIAGVLMACVLVPAGLYFFSRHQRSGDPLGWKLPWCLLVVATMLAFQIDPIFSFIEGCGFVQQVAHRRLIQAVLGGLAGLGGHDPASWLILSRVDHWCLLVVATMLAFQIDPVFSFWGKLRSGWP